MMTSDDVLKSSIKQSNNVTSFQIVTDSQISLSSFARGKGVVKSALCMKTARLVSCQGRCRPKTHQYLSRTTPESCDRLTVVMALTGS